MSLVFQYYATLDSEELVHGDIVAESKQQACEKLEYEYKNIKKLTIWLKGADIQDSNSDRDLLLGMNQRIDRIDKILRWTVGIIIALILIGIISK